MPFSATRLTLYALISAMEEDLRNAVELHIGHLEPQVLFGAELEPRLRQRYLKQSNAVSPANSSPELLPFLDFADSYTTLNKHANALPKDVATYLRSSTNLLDQIVPIRNRVAHTRPLNYDDLAKTWDCVSHLTHTTVFNWAAVSEVLDKLQTDSSFVFGIKSIFLESEDVQSHNLPLPDFDDTGFLGREKQVQELKKLCLGPYPVITVFGEGGVGKTALAVKVAYELLDSPDNSFDAIVWSTSKTTQLTAQEIVRIQNSISSSLGLFTSVANELAGEIHGEPMEEVLDYLGKFRILLILDNLETVLDDRIRRFLERLPQGSKILLTSRIGLGAFEYPYKLLPMESDEAVNFLRTVASVKNLTELTRVSNKKLKDHCNRMKNNPGFIKWFATAVQAGKRPEEVLSKPDVFLDFCMSNVYEYLQPDSKRVLKSLQCLPGTYSQGELAYLNEIEAVPLERALLQLLTTNFVYMSSTPSGSSYETKYGMPDLPRAFLSKHHVIRAKEAETLVKRKRQLVALGEQIKADQRLKPFSWYTIATRSNSDLFVARKLLDSLWAAKEEQFEAAEQALSEAKSLAPDFFEVHRVEALLRVLQNNIPAAREAYEAAIELEPGSTALRLWFGGFLARYCDDIDAALIQFKKALESSPDSVEVQLEIARMQLYSAEYSSVFKQINALQEAAKRMSEWNRAKYFDLCFGYLQRVAEHKLTSHDLPGCLQELENIIRLHEHVGPGRVDRSMRAKIQRSCLTANQCAARSRGEASELTAREVAEKLRSLSGQVQVVESPQDDSASACISEQFGRIRSVKETFGFIQHNDGADYYFKISEFRGSPSEIQVGIRVAFRIRRQQNRTFATDVRAER